MTLGPNGRLALKIAGTMVLGFMTFIYAIHATFPYDRVKDKFVDALSSKYDVSVGSVERGWLPGAFTMKNVILRTRPSKAGEVPKIIKIDELDIDVGVLSLIGGKMDIDIEARMGPGKISGTITVQKGRVRASLASKALPLSDVPGLASVIGMPMGGRGNVTARLDLPNNDWRKASARLTIECPACTVGGEGAFFKPKNTNARTEGFVGQGVPVPLLNIANLSAQWTIEKGKIKTDRFIFQSPHLQLELEFEATVEKDLSKSKVDSACLRYRGTEELKTLSEKFYDALELTGGPLGPDDQRHLKLVGTLGAFKALPRLCGPGQADGADVAGGGGGGVGTHSRPTLNNVPVTADNPEGAIQPAMPTTPPDAMPSPQPDDVKAVEPLGVEPPPTGPPIDAQPPAEIKLEEAPPENTAEPPPPQPPPENE
jgi:type II secretion system protein N